MTVQVNQHALEHAKQLIDEGSYAINTVWSRNEPSANQENRYLAVHSWDEFSQWYLAEDTAEASDTKQRYKFPIGDFQRLHRSGVIAAKQRAARYHDADVEQAADELLDLFDRLNAC